jgi:hypothetical protein
MLDQSIAGFERRLPLPGWITHFLQKTLGSGSARGTDSSGRGAAPSPLSAARKHVKMY